MGVVSDARAESMCAALLPRCGVVTTPARLDSPRRARYALVGAPGRAGAEGPGYRIGRASVFRGADRSMWDILLTIGNAVFIPALVPAVMDKRAFVPRKTSGLAVLGIGLVIVGLVGQGLVLSPLMAAVGGLMWAFIFLFRAGSRAT